MAHQAGAAGQCHELTLETDQAAGRDAIFEARAAIVTIDSHVGDLGATSAKSLHHGALMCLFDVDGERFERLVDHAINDLRQYLGPRDRELVTFTSHVLDQNGQVQLPATRY